jgi:uncharacterized OB-fold protein
MAEPEREAILPTIDDGNRPFWEGCGAGELRLQVCVPAGHVRYPTSAVCPVCLASAFEWQAMSGEGKILSWIVFHHAYHPAWADRTPYNVVLVQLAEGPRMFGNVEPIDRTDLAVGAAVRVVFVPVADIGNALGEPNIVIPRWELVTAEPAS